MSRWRPNLFRFQEQLQELEMHFVDVGTFGRSNGKMVLLLHGRYFCGPSWESTIRYLNDVGYRVLAPEQIGFCKSSKPENYQLSLHQLAANTAALLKTLGISKVTIIGHSLGGMLAMRFGLLYPGLVEKLVLAAPVGLEDYIAKGVPYRSVGETISIGNILTLDILRGDQKYLLYARRWTAEYERPLQLYNDVLNSAFRQTFIQNQARILNAVLTGPVERELKDLKASTLIIVGEMDTSYIGRLWAPSEVQWQLGKYQVLGETACQKIPACQLRIIPAGDHVPQLSNFTYFSKLLKDFLQPAEEGGRA